MVIDKVQEDRARTGAALELRDVSKAYGSVRAVEGIDLDVAEGECLALLGPSGCGKTSLLRLVAGFVEPDRGEIVCAGRRIDGLKPYSRGFGVVFQNYALFPHMTVAQNVGYGLRVRGAPRQDVASRVERMLERVGLAGLDARYPNALSGGQQQRVALARAIVTEPSLLLLDEPLGALDKNLREDMQVELRELQKRLGITTIIVTHDQEEAMTLSDRIAVMNAGRFQQVGSPREVYGKPKNAFVAAFLGTTNLVDAKVIERREETLLVEIEGLRISVPANGADPGDGRLSVSIRPESLSLASEGAANRIAARVTSTLFQGHRVLVVAVTDAGTELRLFAPAGVQSPRETERIFIEINSSECVALS